jgi:hypothetical protein
MKNKIDIKAESFPWQAKLLGALSLFVAFSIAFNYWWMAVILAVVGLILLTGYSGTEIDTNDKTVREYTSYLFFRTGATEKYNEIEKVFINQANVSQKMYTAHTLNSSTFRFTLYNAYAKFGNGNKIFLTSRKDKTKLIEFLNPMVIALGVDLVDNTI